MKAHKVIVLTKAVVAFHSILTTVNENDRASHHCPNTFIGQEGPNGLCLGEWKHDIQNMNFISSIRNVGASMNYDREAKWVRKQFKDYF